MTGNIGGMDEPRWIGAGAAPLPRCLSGPLGGLGATNTAALASGLVGHCSASDLIRVDTLTLTSASCSPQIAG